MSYHQIIYNKFRQAGMTEAGALGMLGNWEAESNCEPNRVQGDYNPYRTVSKNFTEKVMSGVYGKDRFVNNKSGYGLAQWTLGSRQSELYDFWKASGKRLDDANMQISFALKELKRDFISTWRLLCSSSDLYSCVKDVCYKFENPEVKNVDTRFRYANEIKQQIQLDNWQKEEPMPSPTPDPTPEPDHSLQLRMVDKHCSSFTEVYLLKAVLINRGYDSANGGLLAIDDIWTEALTEAVIQFQKDFGLDADGVVGSKTWTKLFEM